MNTIQKFNCFDQAIIDKCCDDYYSRNSYDTKTMNKTHPGESLKLLHEIIEDIYEKKLIFCSGNFYKHSIPYLPHTDYKSYQDNTINVVIPLEYKGTRPSLIIFDQIWEQDSITWCMHHKPLYFETNIGVKGCPYEYPVKNLTGLPINDDLYQYLSCYPKETLFGLSGTAYPFDVGSIIIFDNKRIHCTSVFVGTKLGISLRFKEL